MIYNCDYARNPSSENPPLSEFEGITIKTIGGDMFTGTWGSGDYHQEIDYNYVPGKLARNQINTTHHNSSEYNISQQPVLPYISSDLSKIDTGNAPSITVGVTDHPTPIITSDASGIISLASAVLHATGITGLIKKLVNPNPTKEKGIKLPEMEDTRMYITTADIPDHSTREAMSPKDKKFMDSILNDEEIIANLKKAQNPFREKFSQQAEQSLNIPAAKTKKAQRKISL